MSIAKQIIVRYRAEGHVRFAVPPELCQDHIAQHLQQQLAEADGIYRVDLYRNQGKLSIRYIEGVTDFKAVARALFAAITGLDFNAPIDAPSCCATPSHHPVSAAPKAEGIVGWAQAKCEEIRETFIALGIVVRAAGKAKPIVMTEEREKFLVDFLTDILVLYLIKLHWHMILTEWMRRPWTYRNEWMATFYLIFLLVRSKKPKPE